ncbi:MAG: hypothetical protein N3H84_07630 [Candidatus Caldarchaeum sp.]|nr:hypothetical protein [Candidatus Caldarchaeum sp.]MCX8201953.1 hypothetical protein [Candidatus Caldarchaeum sp.]MDW8435082.1 hypothetical protein [Candidatus Caldarchaeum sp.]
MSLWRLLPSVLGVVAAVLLFSGIYVAEFTAGAGEQRAEALAVTPQMRSQTAAAPDVFVAGWVWLGSLFTALAVFGVTKLMLRRRFS